MEFGVNGLVRKEMALCKWRGSLGLMDFVSKEIRLCDGRGFSVD